MSSRLRYVVIDFLGLTIEACSRQLGYANSSSLRKAMSGEGFVDSEKLFALSMLKNHQEQTANIHWIITGKGSPYLDSTGSEIIGDPTLIQMVNSLKPNKKCALLEFLK